MGVRFISSCQSILHHLQPSQCVGKGKRKISPWKQKKIILVDELEAGRGRSAVGWQHRSNKSTIHTLKGNRAKLRSAYAQLEFKISTLHKKMEEQTLKICQEFQTGRQNLYPRSNKKWFLIPSSGEIIF